jgi:hypothetical protein
VILSSASLELPKRDAPSATKYHDPVWLVRRAWSAHRLPQLQAIVRQAIEKLQTLAPADLLGMDWVPPRRNTPAPGPALAARVPDPIMEALRACCAELRDASGMAGSEVARAAHCDLVRLYISQQSEGWQTTFSAALDKYRHVACSTLLRSLDLEPLVT